MKPNLPLGFVLIMVAALVSPFVLTERQASAEKAPAVVPITVPSAPAERPAEAKIVEMVVTSYCPCEICCEGWSKYKRTSVGDDATVCDGVAADPKLLPYRTKLRIPGVGVREVDDTGGEMRKDGRRGIYHIDLRMKTHAEARRWGVQRLKVEILRKR